MLSCYNVALKHIGRCGSSHTRGSHLGSRSISHRRGSGGTSSRSATLTASIGRNVRRRLDNGSAQVTQGADIVPMSAHRTSRVDPNDRPCVTSEALQCMRRQHMAGSSIQDVTHRPLHALNSVARLLQVSISVCKCLFIISWRPSKSARLAHLILMQCRAAVACCSPRQGDIGNPLQVYC